MPEHVQRGQNGLRLRKMHKKSRMGCRNCKLRRVKCDETRPNCEKCTSFGVDCNYDLKAPDLQMSHDGIASIKLGIGEEAPLFSVIPPVHIRKPSPYPTIEPPSLQTLQNLDLNTTARLIRFGTRTVLSIGTLRTGNVYQAAIPKLLYEHSFLLNVIQTLTLIHDRFLSPIPQSQHTPLEFHHWNLATSQFNSALSSLNVNDPLSSRTRDALWATAAILGAIAFSSIEALSPQDAWPLSPASPTDLSWLRMSTGKSAIWNITNPLRPESLFASLKDETLATYLPSAQTPAKSGLERVPRVFLDLFELDVDVEDGESAEGCPEESPYFKAVVELSDLLNMDCDRGGLGRFLGFICYMKSSFYELLRQKDPRALLVLAFWYAKILGATWWIERRAEMESKAICIFLEEECRDWEELIRLLRWPKMRCGLLEVGMKERVEVELEWTRILN